MKNIFLSLALLIAVLGFALVFKASNTKEFALAVFLLCYGALKVLIIEKLTKNN